MFIQKGLLLYRKGKFFFARWMCYRPPSPANVSVLLLLLLSEPLLSGRDRADEPPTLIKEDLLSAATVQRSPADTQVSSNTNTSQDCTKWDQHSIKTRGCWDRHKTFWVRNWERPRLYISKKNNQTNNDCLFLSSLLLHNWNSSQPLLIKDPASTQCETK